ncbi:MAG: protein-L-isoaspartate O-methyltransferase [Promicromonosporaceae bacterium]|nr:protein-L-isoaspartate O-methyltransferase [Promicromonosporaceae bacterium]
MDDDVASAFRETDRRHFLPPEAQRWAAVDSPLPIGQGQTNSQPSTVATMLRMLATEPGQQVLDVGAGSGWTTALLAHLVGPTGQVLGVERHESLRREAAKNLAALNRPWAAIVVAKPEVLGWPRQGGWNRILVSAAATRLPVVLVKQLALGGRMVIPVANSLLIVEKSKEGTLNVTEHCGYRFVPLIEPTVTAPL